MGGCWVTREGRCGFFLGTFAQSQGTASPLRAASHSAIFCACVYESKIPKMFYLSKKISNSCIELSLKIKFLLSAHAH